MTPFCRKVLARLHVNIILDTVLPLPAYPTSRLGDLSLNMEAAQPSKRELVNVQSLFLTIDGKGDSTKLLSLLALAAGAIAMPQTGNADIIFTDLSASPVTVGNNATTNFLIDTLPGTARLGAYGPAGPVGRQPAV